MSPNRSPSPRIVIAGGGTGGHVYPAIAIRQALAVRRPDAEVIFVGTKGGIESRIVPGAGERLVTIWISGWSRSRPMRNVLLPLKLLVSVLQSLLLFLRFRPQVAVGTGGYVMGPVLWIAQRLGIPTVLQEQNSFPGVTTKKLARKAAAVCVGFEDAKRRLPKGAVIYTGNPLRLSFRTLSRETAMNSWHLDFRRKTLLVVGGSAGARSINEAVGGALPQLTAGYNLIWQTGKTGVPAHVDRSYLDEQRDARHLVVLEFVEDMPNAYAVGDLAICRAGAMTIAELTAAGLPAVLIPYPFATDDHQTVNADSVAAQGAARVIPDRELSPEILLAEIDMCLSSPDVQSSMAAAMRSMARPNAAFDVADVILRAAGSGT